MSLLTFDFDGTLYDSMPHVHRGVCHVFTTCGLPSPTLKEFLLELKPPYSSFYRERGITIDEAQIDALFVAKANEPGALLFDDVAPAIRRYASLGYSLAIVSGNYRSTVDRVLTEAGLRGYFSDIRGECESKTDALKNIAARLGYPISETLMIGDTVLDVSHAKQIGMRAIGIIRYPDLLGIAPHLIEAGAEACIASLDELDQYLPLAPR